MESKMVIMMIMMISSVIKILIPTNWTEAAEFSPVSNTHKLGLEGMNVKWSVVASFGDESHADRQNHYVDLHQKIIVIMIEKPHQPQDDHDHLPAPQQLVASSAPLPDQAAPPSQSRPPWVIMMRQSSGWSKIISVIKYLIYKIIELTWI